MAQITDKGLKDFLRYELRKNSDAVKQLSRAMEVEKNNGAAPESLILYLMKEHSINYSRTSKRVMGEINQF